MSFINQNRHLWPVATRLDGAASITKLQAREERSAFLSREGNLGDLGRKLKKAHTRRVRQHTGRWLLEQNGTLPLYSRRPPRGRWGEGVGSKTLPPGEGNCQETGTGTQQGKDTVRIGGGKGTPGRGGGQRTRPHRTKQTLPQ